jgi:hypothetical protein
MEINKSWRILLQLAQLLINCLAPEVAVDTYGA